jgi:hypothetical protein
MATNSGVELSWRSRGHDASSDSQASNDLFRINKRRRGTTEEERNRKKGERDSKAKTKQRAKEVEDGIRDAYCNWGNYNIDLLTSSIGEEELYDFLQ